MINIIKKSYEKMINEKNHLKTLEIKLREQRGILINYLVYYQVI